MGIGNLGLAEILIIGLFVLLFFGPGRLPEVARSAGQLLRELRRGMNEVRRELEEVERSTSDGGGREEERPSGPVHPPGGGPHRGGEPDPGGAPRRGADPRDDDEPGGPHRGGPADGSRGDRPHGGEADAT